MFCFIRIILFSFTWMLTDYADCFFKQKQIFSWSVVKCVFIIHTYKISPKQLLFKKETKEITLSFTVKQQIHSPSPVHIAHTASHQSQLTLQNDLHIISCRQLRWWMFRFDRFSSVFFFSLSNSQDSTFMSAFGCCCQELKLCQSKATKLSHVVYWVVWRR